MSTDNASGNSSDIATDGTGCPQCGRKILPSISNRCMYCGAELPEEHHLTAQEKSALLSEKLERFKQTEANADEVIRNMRRDFGIPEPKKSKKQRSQDREAEVLTAALASINKDKKDGGGPG